MPNPDDYCENGIHFIGDEDECDRCDVWEEMMREARDAGDWRS